MERLHAAAASGQLKMSEPRDPQARKAIFQAAVGLLEEDRAKLDVVLGALKEMVNGVYSETTPPLSAPIIPDGSNAPPPTAPAGAEAPGQAVTGAARTALPQYYLCDTCDLWIKPGLSHTCTEDGVAKDCYNGFNDEELNIIHGSDGWEEIDRPADQHVLTVESKHVSQQIPINKENEENNAEDGDDNAYDLGIRPGSKLDKVYKLSRELIEKNGPTHIDDMLEPAAKGQFFFGVQNRRANLANFLSKLKRKGLLASDNRGYWFLPQRKAGK
jgi:hypothetical protein